MKTPIGSMLTKPAGYAILLFLVSGLSFAQDMTGFSPSDLSLPGGILQAQSDDEKKLSYSLSINVADVLVMGPVIQADCRIAKKTDFGVFFVYHYMGWLAGPLIFEKNITAHSPKSMGGGVYARQYFNLKSLNPWYCGIYLGYSHNEATYHSGFPNERVEKLNDLLLFASAGRRWNLGKRFYVLTGIQIGFAYTYSDDIYSSYTLDPATGTYLKKESFYMEWPTGVYPYPVPEIAFGIYF